MAMPRTTGASRVQHVASTGISRRARSVRVMAMDMPDGPQFPYVKPAEVKRLYQDKGYLVLDVRTPQEHNEASKRWFINLPLAFETEKGPVFNKNFREELETKYANKLARLILACDDGSDRSDIASGILKELGYTNVFICEGGVDAYLKVDPLDAKDKKPRWKLTGQTSGVRYAYNDGEGDDSA